MTVRQRPRLARNTIVGWMVLVLFVSLLGVTLIVRQSLHQGVSDRAADEAAAQLDQFQGFAQRGVDPRTGAPFASADRLLSEYLAQTRPPSDAVLLGSITGRGEMVLSRGVDAPEPQDYDPADDADLRRVAQRADSGQMDTPEGEMRWARTVVEEPSGAGDGSASGQLIVTVFTEEAQEEADETVRTLAMVSLAALAFAALVSFLVAGRLLRPVRLVHEAAAEITEHDLTRRIDVGDDDVSGLAATFNRMLDRLEAAFRAEQRFVDDAGHELRTPITVIRGHLELMDEDPRARAATLALVTGELDRMARIVTDLLALATSDRPDFVRPADGVDVSLLMVELEAKISALAQRRWRLGQIAEGEARIDAQRITQAILQLAHNAVQHTSEGDVITLSSALVEDPSLGRSLTMTVADTGPGVPVADRERIFERFAHGEPLGGGRHSGAGLGLAIVRAIADGHGGRIEVGGQVGQGASFTLVVPVGSTTRMSQDRHSREGS